VHWGWRWDFRTITMKCELFVNYLCFVSFKQSINTNNKSFTFFNTYHNGFLSSSFKQVYLRIHWQLDTCIYERFYSE
jgi:hypothetical protein